MGVLVPETLTAAPGPVHPIPAHHPPDIARANRPVWGSIAGIPQGSRVQALRVICLVRGFGWGRVFQVSAQYLQNRIRGRAQ